VTNTLLIVIPVLDEGSTLGARLAALEPLRVRGARIVVVDGGSADDTAAVARRSGVDVIAAPRGRASQMNAGAAAGDESVVLFLHADTELPDRADTLIATALEDHGWGRFDVRIDSPRPILRMVSLAMNERSHLSGIATGDQAIFVRRGLFERTGGFPDQPLMEDVALSRALTRTGRPARIRTRVTTSARRWEQHGAWRTIVLMWRTRFEYFFGADPERLAVRYGYRPRD
jgi:rSAM/selenodomain-associated transferase 2